MSTGTTLYYPYIHPRPSGSIKSALLYWDRVRRIVPSMLTYGGRIQGDDDEARLLADHGLLVATPPESYEESAARQFFQAVEPQSEQFRIDFDTAREMASRNRGFHIEKIGGGALQKMHELGLAHRFGDWVSMRDEVGAFYMFCLASEMSRRMSAPLLAESSEDSEVGQSLLFEPGRDSADEVSETLVTLGVELPSPEQLRNVPADKIARFSERRAAERGEFRQAIEGLLETARTMPRDAVPDYLASQRIRIEAARRNLSESLDELKVAGAWSMVKITVPTVVPAAVSAFYLPPVAASVLAATGIALGTVACIAETRGKLRQARTGSPYHYLISMAREFPDRPGR